jgi:trehalose synthase
MGLLSEVHITPLPIERFVPLLGEGPVREAERAASALREAARDRVVWNLNSTGVGGGVAEMLRSLIAYARGAGVDARWLVIHGSPEFFRVTKRLHNALHGEVGDGSPLGPHEHCIYDDALSRNAQELLAMVRERDVVLLHDPQTTGLAPYLQRAGAEVLWRCHIGADRPNDQTALGWAFLAPYLRDVEISVFTRRAYIPSQLAGERATVIVPSIDPFSAKNQALDEETVRAILVHVGLVSGPATGHPSFTREDGAPGRVDHYADVLRLGPPPTWETPQIVQVSRWDRLKDPVGVLQGFARLAESGGTHGAVLLLVGPNVHAVADDPDGAQVFAEVTEVWRALPHNIRSKVHLVNLPTVDVEENAAIVNAIQRHAAIVVQKSLREGFGLTVTEAMWKTRPLVASAVGGIQDQIEDGVQGLLLSDPRDLGAFAEALRQLLTDPARAQTLGENAHARALERYLGVRHLIEYGQVIARLDARREKARATG